MVLICLCLLVYDCSEVRLEVRPDGWISVVSVSAYRAFQSYYYSVFCQVFMDHEDDINTFRVLAESVLLLAVTIGSYLCTTGYEKYHYGNHIFCILLYIAGLSYKIIGGAILIAVPLLIIFLSIVVQPDQTLIKDYQRTRIMSFLYPEKRGIPGGY